MTTREAVYRRDGFRCKICYKNQDQVVLNADHMLSRRHKGTYYDVRNLTTLCAACNRAKFWNQANLPYRVAKIVEIREGEEAIRELEQMARKPKKWTIDELQGLIVKHDRMFR